MNEWEFIAIAAHSGRWRCQVKDTLEDERRRKKNENKANEHLLTTCVFGKWTNNQNKEREMCNHEPIWE